MSTCSPGNTQQGRTTRFVSNFVTPDWSVLIHAVVLDFLLLFMPHTEQEKQYSIEQFTNSCTLVIIYTTPIFSQRMYNTVTYT